MPKRVKVRRVRDNSRALIDGLHDGFSSIVAGAISEEMLGAVRSNAPVDTGRLRDNITVEIIDERWVELQAGTFYAGFIEFGTVNIPSRPFFRPVVDEYEKAVTNTVAKRIGADAKKNTR